MRGGKGDREENRIERWLSLGLTRIHTLKYTRSHRLYIYTLSLSLSLHSSLLPFTAGCSVDALRGVEVAPAPAAALLRSIR